MDEPLVFSAAFEAGERLRSFNKLLLIKDSISFFLAGAAGLGLDFLSVDAIMSGLCSVQAYRVSNKKTLQLRLNYDTPKIWGHRYSP